MSYEIQWYDRKNARWIQLQTLECSIEHAVAEFKNQQHNGGPVRLILILQSDSTI